MMAVAIATATPPARAVDVVELFQVQIAHRFTPVFFRGDFRQ